MIERAVLSYYNAEESFGNKCGFNSFKDFLASSALSLVLARKHFKEVQFMSTDWAISIFKQIGMPVSEYSNKLNEMKHVSKYFWAYAKIIAYADQKKPFVHLDNDVFLWDPLPPRILKARFCFQSQEPFNLPGYIYYYILKNASDAAKFRPKKIVDNPVWDYAYNCGICGGHELDFYQEWKAVSESYIFAPENQNMFFIDFKDILIHQNLYHEQYFATCLIKMRGQRDQVEVLDIDAMQISKKYKYTHLWGTIKQQHKWMQYVYMQLHRLDPQLSKRIEHFCQKQALLEKHVTL